MTEINNTLKGISSRLDNTKEWISELKGRVEEITEAEQKKRKENIKKLGQFKRPLRQH